MTGRWMSVVGAVVCVAIAAPAARSQPVQRLTVQQAVDLALRQNPQVQVAAFDVAIARAQLAQARAGTAVQVSVQGSYTRTQEQEPIGFGSLTLPPPSPNVYDARLVAQYPLATGGRVEAQIAVAEANLRGAEAALQRVRQQVVFSVRQAYYQVLLAQAGEAAAERGLAQATENLRVARARVAAGVSPRFDEVQAEVAVASARQALVRARNGVAQARQALNAALNQPLDTPLELVDGFATEPVQTPLAQLVARALLVRPELAELAARRDAARAAVEVAASGGRISLVLSGAYVYSNTGALGPGTDFGTTWSVTLAATLAVADGGLTQQRVVEAQQRLAQLEAALGQQRQGIEVEVRQAYLSLESAREELAGADALVAQAVEALRIAQVRFAAGVGTALEVISAQASLSQAEAARAQAQFAYSVARAQLERAVGEAVR
ncbi:MAG: TolC family protein [Armatimonadota bacterium]|nr:TolC family protein [Armatimonadota bacterium]MDR7611730.1 TolC family protein [Armatimonadota bacterium]